LSEIVLSDRDVGELVNGWLDYTPSSLEDLAYKYVSVCLSIPNENLLRGLRQH